MVRKLKNIELNRLSPEEFRKTEKKKVSVLLDNVRSMLNVGSVFRTCDAFAVSHLYLGGITGTPPHREITKSAIGAELSMEWSHTKSAVETIVKLKETGTRVVAVEQTDQSIEIQDLAVESGKDILLVFGNEVDGVSDDVLALCDDFVEIPQYGTKHSLNVSVSAGIAIWEIQKKIS